MTFDEELQELLSMYGFNKICWVKNVGWMGSNIIIRVKWKHNFIWVGRNMEVGVRVHERKHLISYVC